MRKNQMPREGTGVTRLAGCIYILVLWIGFFAVGGMPTPALGQEVIHEFATMGKQVRPELG